jgi:hypothetical protein
VVGVGVKRRIMRPVQERRSHRSSGAATQRRRFAAAGLAGERRVTAAGRVEPDGRDHGDERTALRADIARA